MIPVMVRSTAPISVVPSFCLVTVTTWPDLVRTKVPVISVDDAPRVPNSYPGSNSTSIFPSAGRVVARVKFRAYPTVAADATKLVGTTVIPVRVVLGLAGRTSHAWTLYGSGIC